MGLVSKKLKLEIGNHNLLLVFAILERITLGTDIYLLKARYSYWEKQDVLGTMLSDERNSEISKIRQSISSILPEDDLDAFKSYLTNLKLLNEKNRTLELLLKCSERFQQRQVKEEYEEGQLNLDIEYEIEQISRHDLLSNWAVTLWDDLSNFVFSNSNDVPATAPQSEDIYLNSILKLEKTDKKINFNQLFLWAEQYATEDYEDAYSTAQTLRLENARGKYPSYEYLFLSYAHKCRKADSKEEDDKWFLTGSKKYKKLKIYLNHAKSLHADSTTLSYSQESIGSLLLGELEALFDHTNHDYIRNTKPGNKKECIIQIFESCRQIKDDFSIKGNHRIFEKLLVELMGGAKFRWLSYGESGITNLVAFDAKSTFEKWKTFLEEVDPPAISRASDALKGNIRYKIGSLSILKNKGIKQRELQNSCFLADHFFPEGGFLDLAKNIAKGNKDAIQGESQFVDVEPRLFSEKSALDFTDKKIKELLSEEQKSNQSIEFFDDQLFTSNENLIVEEEQEFLTQVHEKEMLTLKNSEANSSHLGLIQIKDAHMNQYNIIAKPVLPTLTSSSKSLESRSQNAKTSNWLNIIVKNLSKPQLDLYIIWIIFILGWVPFCFLKEDLHGRFISLFFLILMGVSFFMRK